MELYRKIIAEDQIFVAIGNTVLTEPKEFTPDNEIIVVEQIRLLEKVAEPIVNLFLAIERNRKEEQKDEKGTETNSKQE